MTNRRQQRSFNSIEEFREATGTTLGVSPWREVSQQGVDSFARATDDWQWLHCDPVRAKESTFGSTIAHGYFTVSLLSSFAQDIYVVNGVSHVVNYGIDRLRFPAPVPVGSSIRATARLDSVSPVRQHFLAAVHYEVEVLGGGKPALIADTLVALIPEPTGAAALQ